ncbi:putative Fungal specific transcription factor [Ophiocordyceps camponoti-floridani]|uniref:Putative Fungal specific transcription factor n=1 Tax=Ophiocordyceps camponoti-floridani TaxID=2030778 RepID=A0A8H4VDN0_9HYPO|nr:putative Fungal specific transcription factor [Ophiocordyceps camponoti-floridani]
MSAFPGDGYEPAYPEQGSGATEDIKAMLTDFYRTSDQTEADERWVSLFTRDAQVTIGGDEAVGEDEIRKMRLSMWEKTQGRKHNVAKVFPGRFADGGWEAMVLGEVRLTMEGTEVVVPWSGHAVLRRGDDGEWRFARYRVWLQWR